MQVSKTVTPFLKEGLGPAGLLSMRNKSNSRRNMAKRVAAEMFTLEERLTCNVNGRQGKRLFDPLRMEKVKKAVFFYWALEPKECMDKE